MASLAQWVLYSRCKLPWELSFVPAQICHLCAWSKATTPAYLIFSPPIFTLPRHYILTLVWRLLCSILPPSSLVFCKVTQWKGYCTSKSGLVFASWKISFNQHFFETLSCLTDSYGFHYLEHMILFIYSSSYFCLRKFMDQFATLT